MAKKYFGTDGIRGAVNSKYINGDMFFRFGLASGTYFKSQKKRKLLLPKILLLSSDYGIGQSSAREIDKLGIRVATELSMIRALKKLKEKPSELIIDGPLLLRPWKGIQKNIVSGDSKFISIASASIVAKVSRDNLMERLEKKYSGYMIF